MKLFFDSEQLIILRHPFRTTQASGLDLTHVQAHGQVSNRGIFRLTASVGDDRFEATLLRQLHSINRLGQGSDLIRFDEDGIAGFFINRSLKTLHIRDEKIIPDDLNPVSDESCKLHPAFPVIFVEGVFEGGIRQEDLFLLMAQAHLPMPRIADAETQHMVDSLHALAP